MTVVSGDHISHSTETRHREVGSETLDFSELEHLALLHAAGPPEVYSQDLGRVGTQRCRACEISKTSQHCVQ